MTAKAIVLIALLAFSNTERSGVAEPPKLPGNLLETKAAILKCDAVFVARITGIRNEDKRLNGPVVCSGVQIQLLRSLMGSIDSHTTYTIYVSIPREDLPYGDSYIFLVKRNDAKRPDHDPYVVLKILRATDDNISKVKKLIPI